MKSSVSDELPDAKRNPGTLSVSHSELQAQNSLKRVLRKPAVLNRLGWSKSTLYSRIQDGQFCKPIAIGPRCVGWLEDEVDAYILSCIAARDGKQKEGVA